MILHRDPPCGGDHYCDRAKCPTCDDGPVKCSTEWHEAQKLVPGWWDTCKRKGEALGLDWRNCPECNSTLAIPVEGYQEEANGL